MRKFKKPSTSIKAVLVCAALAMSAAATSPAFAYSECVAKVSRVYLENGGYVWFNLAGGGAVEILATNPNKDSYYSTLLTALTTQSTVTVRLYKDNANCSAINSDIWGIWLN
jgi:hypothetical protein